MSDAKREQQSGGVVDLAALFLEEGGGPQEDVVLSLSEGIVKEVAKQAAGPYCEVCSPSPTTSDSVSSLKRSTGLSNSKTPSSLETTNDGRSELTFDSWISTDVCDDIWTCASSDTDETESIATPVTTQDYLWKIFESVNTEDIGRMRPVEVSTPVAQPSQKRANLLSKIFGRKLSFQKPAKNLRELFCFGQNPVYRKPTVELEGTVVVPHVGKPHVAGGTEYRKNCQSQGSTPVESNGLSRRRARGQSCGVKE